MRKLKPSDLTVQLIGILISFFIFILGFSLNFDFSPDAQVAAKIVVTTACSIYVLIVSERISAAIRERNSLKKLQSSIPQTLQTIYKFSDSNEALEYISSKLSDSRLVLNTRIEKDGERINAAKKILDARQRYDSQILKSLESEIEFREVVTSSFVPPSKERQKQSNAAYGLYDVRLCETIPSSFLNFTILKYDSERELVIGWATADYDINQPAYRITDDRIIDYFEGIHKKLFDKGKRIT